MIFILLINYQIKAQNVSLNEITDYNTYSSTMHAMQVNDYLYSLVSISQPEKDNSGYKIYKANQSLQIVDSTFQFYSQSSTFITNMVKGLNGQFKFALSEGGRPLSLKIYSMDDQLRILDSINISDNNFLFNKFTFANLIEGPNGDFVLNSVFYKDTIPYNVYYLFDQSLQQKNMFSDSMFLPERNYNNIATSNMLFINNQYVALQTSPPGVMEVFNAVKRFTTNLELTKGEKIKDQPFYAHNIFHTPLDVNGKLLIANMFRFWQGSQSHYSANLIELDTNNLITQRTFFKPEYGKVDGGARISNYGAIYDNQKQTIELVFTSGGNLPQIIKLVFDTTYNLIRNTTYEYPVNKKDTVFSRIQMNGCIKFNNKFLVYGWLMRSLKGSTTEFNTTYLPFIETIDDLNIILGTENQEFSSNNLKIYPNPFSKEITIEFDANNVQLIIYDNIGRLAHFQTIVPNETLNLEHLKAGMYYLNAKGQDGKITTQKIIKVD
jgi:hypothetical protein